MAKKTTTNINGKKETHLDNVCIKCGKTFGKAIQEEYKLKIKIDHSKDTSVIVDATNIPDKDPRMTQYSELELEDPDSDDQ